jgi:magnesium chelatase family protein
MKFFTLLNHKLDPALQEVEVATFFQLPNFQIIGLPGPEVAEARERIRAAIEASGIEFPRRKVVLNLSPASVKKRGTGLDLAMALAVLSASMERESIRVGAWGELGLDGKVKSAGQLTRVIYAAWREKLSYIVLSRDEFPNALKSLKMILQVKDHECPNAYRQFVGEPPKFIPVETLREAWTILKQEIPKPLEGTLEGFDFAEGEAENSFQSPSNLGSLMPLSPSLERVVSASVAGKHHLLLLGPKGAGKSHALEWLMSLQLPISHQNRLQNQMILELRMESELESQKHLQGTVPIRRISSQVRPSTLIGSVAGSHVRPGEFSLAHGGLLLADEFLEWSRDSREVLREPLERGQVVVSRVNGSVEFPAQFQFAGSGNLCPCGGWPASVSRPQGMDSRSSQLCRCPCMVRKKYLSKLSGPILDRIDIVAWVFQSKRIHGVSSSKLDHVEKLQMKIGKAQNLLKQNWSQVPGVMSGAALESLLDVHPTFRSELSKFSGLSLRSQHKILRMAFTLAALDERGEPKSSHFAEAYFYRSEQYFDAALGTS